jgi:hypothetical protein
MNAVAKHEPSNVVVQDSASLMEVISRAAQDPNTDVGKLERLLGMYERITAQKAKADYITALVQMKPKLPVIDRKGRIEVRKKDAGGERTGAVQQSTPYARWEDIDEAITPILAEHGFVLTHRCGTAPDGKILITGVLSHAGGHSEETTMALPHDSSGSKNAVQAVGSSTQYGKRYTAGLLLNIRTRGEDDDGKKGGDSIGKITDAQAQIIHDELDETKSDKEVFCRFMGVDAIPNILAKDYAKAVRAIEAKKKKEAKK